MIPDYKKIADYLSRTGRNSADYWDLTSSECKAEGLPRLFGQDVYDAINEWYGNRPTIQPPHVRDLLATNDSNFGQHEGDEELDEVQSEPDAEDLLDAPQLEPVDTTEASSPPLSPRRSVTPARPAVQPETSTNPLYRPFNSFD